MQKAKAMEQGSTIHIRPLTGLLGAEVFGIDLSAPLTEGEVESLKQAFADYSVVFFRDQTLTLQQQIDFARHFGDLEVHPIVNGMAEHPEVIRMLKPAGESASFGTGWHTDNSFFDAPSLGSVVYGVTIPRQGGDTLFASQYAAYDALSEGMKDMLADIRAIHSANRAYTSDTAREKYEGKSAITYTWSDSIDEEVAHPVIRTHPVTGKKALYVNPMFTLRFEKMTEEESKPLLTWLFHHAVKPDFCCRFRWEAGSVAMWDNRCVQHYAVDDYQEHERLLYRVTLKGEKP